ncbi:MAG: peptidylprolyl isomerase [Flavobacteriales bacterium]|nr:peptidylprolyl isomerase [Flavobacteriales bacterium]
MNRVIILLIVLSFSKFSIAQERHVIDGVAAVVGKNVILNSDIQKGIMQYKAQGVNVDAGMECQVLEDLMVEKLLIHQAVIDSVEVSDAEVDGSVEQRLQMLIGRVGSVKELEKFYNKTEDELREEMFDILKDQLLAQRMQQQIIADIDITPEEVRTYFNNIPKDELPKFGTEVVMAHIVKKPILSAETKEETITKLNDIRTDILNGSSFKTKAILYSEDPGSSGKGGAYYGVRKGQFVKPFEEAAFNLQEGEVSEPFETQFGFHIVQLLKRKGEELDLRHILIKPIVKPEDLEETQLALDSIKSKIINGEITFSDAAKEFSDDEATKFNDGTMINPRTQEGHFELNHLDRDIYFRVESLQVGDISEVIYKETEKGEKEFSIVKLIERIAPHTADFSKDYQKIKQMALGEKKNKISEDWVIEHLSKAFVRISDEYKKCEFKNNWNENAQG